MSKNETMRDLEKRQKKEREALQKTCPHKRTTKWYEADSGTYGIMQDQAIIQALY